MLRKNPFGNEKQKEISVKCENKLRWMSAQKLFFCTTWHQPIACARAQEEFRGELEKCLKEANLHRKSR